MIIKCIFSDEMIRMPVIYELGKQFSVITNIRQAEVTPELGWVILDITGELQEVDRGIEWLKKVGVTVEILKEED